MGASELRPQSNSSVQILSPPEGVGLDFMSSPIYCRSGLGLKPFSKKCCQQMRHRSKQIVKGRSEPLHTLPIFRSTNKETL